MTRPAIQLYTLRDLDATVPELVHLVGETALEGIELAGLGEASTSAISTALEETGLEPVAAHVSLDTLQRDLHGTVATYRALGCETLIVPMVDADRFTSPEAITAFADELNPVGAALADDAMRVGYHNHSFEFERLADGRLAFEHLLAETSEDVLIELDVGLAMWAGADPVSLLEQYGDRISLVYRTDSVPGEEPHHRHYGTGTVDLRACASVARTADVGWTIYEQVASTIRRNASKRQPQIYRRS